MFGKTRAFFHPGCLDGTRCRARPFNFTLKLFSEDDFCSFSPKITFPDVFGVRSMFGDGDGYSFHSQPEGNEAAVESASAAFWRGSRSRWECRHPRLPAFLDRVLMNTWKQVGTPLPQNINLNSVPRAHLPINRCIDECAPSAARAPAFVPLVPLLSWEGPH